LVNGYSGFLPYGSRYTAAALRCYPCPTALRALADLEVRTHVAHVRLLPPRRRRALERGISSATSLRIVRPFDDTLVIRAEGAGPPAADPPGSLQPLERTGWRATSSRGPRGTGLALDASLDTAWSTAIELDDLESARDGLRLLRGLATWRDMARLIPRDEQWFAVDLGAAHAVRRLSLVFGERGGPLGHPAPRAEGSADGARWFDLPSDAVVRPSVRALFAEDRARASGGFTAHGRPGEPDAPGAPGAPAGPDGSAGPARARFEYDWAPTTVRHLRMRHPGYWYLHDVAVLE
jgi:hypothetical protein